jgi:F-type H+-transporting ATPase subunit delta
MRSQVLIKRYAQGLVGALRDEAEFAEANRELAVFQNLLRTNRKLTGILGSPFIPSKKKKQIIKDILMSASFSQKTVRFLNVLFEHNRLDLLDDVLEAVPIIWNERRGVLTFEVNSAFALTEAQRARLQAELERLEGRPVSLSYRIDPELVGGLSLKRGNVVYDVSLKGRLAKLKERMMEG